MMKCQLRRDWYRPIQKSLLQWRLNEVHLLQLLAEIHSGEYGCHAASANLVGKAYRSGFYCPTAMTDAKDLVKRCKGCQFFAKQ
jgi:hypothetical protein